MKKILLFMAALCLSSLSFAQVLVATLQHGDSIRVFYYAEAFVNAYNAAVPGDVISLSAGSFTTCDINKDSLTIRGVGSFGSHPTVFASSFNLGTYTHENNHMHKISMEGIYCDDVNQYPSLEVYYKDVRFNDYYAYNTYSSYTGTTYYPSLTGQFVNCRFVRYYPYSSWTPTLINCMVNDVYASSQSTFVNCVVRDDSFSSSSYNNVSFINSILLYTSNINITSTSYCLPATTYAENCIGVKQNGNVQGDLFARCVNHNCSMTTTAVFSNFSTEGYLVYDRYILTETARTTYLGNDSTQVGLFGGYMPYTTSSTYPVISRLNVAHQTTADGQLSVDIQVGYRQESEDNE